MYSEQHKIRWINYVIDTLKLTTVSQDIYNKIETLYIRGWTAPETINHIKKILNKEI